MNNGKKRNGNELDPTTKEPGCTCGMCHKYKADGSIELDSIFRQELAISGKLDFTAPVWTCHDSRMVSLLSGGGSYGVE